MKIEVSVSYTGGIQWDKDAQLKKVAAKYSGESDSAGCMLIGDMERDIQFTFTSKGQAKGFETEVESLGYKIIRRVQ